MLSCECVASFLWLAHWQQDVFSCSAGSALSGLACVCVGEGAYFFWEVGLDDKETNYMNIHKKVNNNNDNNN